MISVESHSKQIKLLNDYILALEKQVASARKQNEQHSKITSSASDDMKKLNEEINRLRGENGQLRFNNVRQDETIRKLAPLEREVNNGREAIQKLAVENNRLNAVLQQAQENNKGLEERCKNVEAELRGKTEVFAEESQKDKQEMDELKRLVSEKTKQNEELTQTFNQEKKNYANRITSLENNNTELAKAKNEIISRLSKQLEQLKARYSKDMTSNSQARNSLGEQIKQLVTASNENKTEIGGLRKELNQTKQLLDNKTIESEGLASKLSMKVNEYDSFVKRANDEKTNLLKNVQRLEDERKRLEAINNACKGDITENTKALSDALKKGEELNGKLFEANQELSRRYDLIVQNQEEITKQNNIIKELNKEINNKNEEAKVREGYIATLKEQLATAYSEIEQLQEAKTSSLSNLGQLGQTANRLRKELAEAKAEIKDKERNIEDKNILLGKRTDEIHNLQIVVKDHEFTIAKLSTDLDNRNESIKNLNTAKEQLEAKLEAAKNAHEQLNDAKAQLQKDYDSLKAYSANIEKQKAELSSNLTEIMKEKVGDKDLLTRQLTSRDKKILELNSKYEKLESLSSLESKNNAQTIKKLEAEKLSCSVLISEANNEIQSQKKKLQQLQANYVKTKESLETLTQEYNSYRKKKEVEVEELGNQLKESEKKNEKKTTKIEQLNQEIKLLEDNHTNHRKNLGDSQKEELQRQKAKFSKTILELKGQHENILSKKNIEKEQLRQTLEKNIEQLEQKHKNSSQQWLTKEKSLNEQLKRSQEEKRLLEKEVTRLNFSTIAENQSKSSKEVEIQALKKSIERMELYSKEQKNAIDQLNKLIDSKSKEIETIEQSNAMLRKQVINALTHEQTSRKELVQAKSKVSLILTNSKHDFRPPVLTPSGARSQLLTKKKTTFSQKEDLQTRGAANGRLQKVQTEKMKFSLVEDLNDSNFGQRFD